MSGSVGLVPRVMPLLTELEDKVGEPPCYKHGARNGACPSAPVGRVSGLLIFDHGPSVETLGYCQPFLRDEGVRSFVASEAPGWLGRSGRFAGGA
jgi:hypothetical protein